MSNKIVKARLYLYAVLQLFEEVAREDKEAKKIASNLSGVLQFSAPSGLAAQVEFRDKGVKATPGKAKKADVILFIPTVKMVNNMFSGKGFALPLPVKGLLKIKLLLGFMKLGDRLAFYMEPGDKPPKGEVKKIISTLLLYAAVFGAAEVGEADPEVKEAVKKIPNGTAHVEVKNGPSVYVTKTGSEFTANKGRPRDYTAYLGFKDFDVAYGMLNGQLDLMAAIPVGDIEISGSIPMVDELGRLMERAGKYLE
jgi:hypothetical protein